MIGIRRFFVIAISILFFTNNFVSANTKSSIKFISSQKNNIWKKADFDYIFELKVKNGDIGSYKVQFVGDRLVKWRNKNDYVISGGKIAIVNSNGMVNVIDDAWSGYLTRFIGTVDLSGNGVDDLFFVSQHGISTEHWDYNLLNIREMEVITYTVFVDANGREGTYSSNNFSDERFSREAVFLQNLINDWSASKSMKIEKEEKAEQLNTSSSISAQIRNMKKKVHRYVDKWILKIQNAAKKKGKAKIIF